MKKSSIFLLTLICCLIGILFFLIQRKWLIIQWTFNAESHQTALTNKETVLKKEIVLYCWKNEKEHREKTTLIWRHNKNAENIKQVANYWLDNLKSEKIMSQMVAIESVVLSPTEQDAYFSFNQVFTWKEWSVYEKWMLIESLCKTIKSANISIKYITLLVNHEPMIDDHLQFSCPWPVDGFIDE